jgi:hypothetical protein
MSTRTFSSVGVVLLLAFLLPLRAFGAGRQRVLAVSPPSSGLELVFVSAPAGIIDAGTIVAHGGSRRATVSTRTVRIRIGEASPEPRGTATLRAFLETADPRCTIRVNGVVLAAAPRAIGRHLPIGIAVPHRIEIEVPINAAEGPLLASIGWEVSTD